MIDALRPVLVVVALSGSAVAEGRLADSWLAMVEGCVALAETGDRAVFDGWDIAFDGGEVCNGDPACEDDDMTFIAPGPLGTGAVTVRVGDADWVGRKYFGRDPAEARVASFPAHVFCASADGVRHSTADLGTAHGVWVVRQRAAARLFPADGYVSLEAGPYVGCGFDGRQFLVEFSLARPGPAVVRMNYPTRAHAAAATPMVCGGVTS
jgi:hypothetical protein